MHHIGAAPDEVPVHTDAGVGATRATGWQLADRTPRQLDDLREATAAAMTAAAGALEFERAAALRDELGAIEAEVDRRARARSR